MALSSPRSCHTLALSPAGRFGPSHRPTRAPWTYSASGLLAAQPAQVCLRIEAPREVGVDRKEIAECKRTDGTRPAGEPPL